MFRRLAESSPRWVILTTIEGYVFSIVAHVIILGSALVPRVPDVMTDEIPEAYRWAEFLLPPDRPAGSQARETVSYMTMEPAPGGEGLLPVPSDREPERLQIVQPEGTGADEQEEVQAVPPTPTVEIPADTVMTVLEVDTAAARYEDSAAPPYPPSLLQRRMEGSVAVQYIVDTTGRADTASIVVLSTTHPEFARSVRSTLPLMRFRPAVMSTRKVRQLVQQLFTFRIDSTTTARPRRPESSAPLTRGRQL
ncbi:MAG: TonB family protein [Gemmatimonadota bacterium]